MSIWFGYPPKKGDRWWWLWWWWQIVVVVMIIVTACQHGWLLQYDSYRWAIRQKRYWMLAEYRCSIIKMKIKKVNLNSELDTSGLDTKAAVINLEEFIIDGWSCNAKDFFSRMLSTLTTELFVLSNEFHACFETGLIFEISVRLVQSCLASFVERPAFLQDNMNTNG